MVPGRGLAVWRCGIHKEHRVAKNLRGDRKRAGCGARARSAGVAQASARGPGDGPGSLARS